MINNLSNKICYKLESIKNRYPCKIIKIKNCFQEKSKTSIIFQAVNRFNLRDMKLEEILNDPLLVEKFHPTDCIKMGFLAAGEILNSDNHSNTQAKQEFRSIFKKMFENY